MTDFIFMVRDTSYMFVTGPDVVKTVTNEVVTAEELGGAKVHTTKSSIADGAFENDVEAILQIRRLLDFLPSNNIEGVPEIESFDDVNRLDMSLDTLIPDNPNKPYDMGELIRRVVDEATSSRSRRLRPQHHHRLRPRRGTHRRLRRQPAAGARGRARFGRLAEGGPLRALLQRLLDPDRDLRRRAGLPAGTAQEYGGLIKHGAKLLFAYNQATVPLVTIITRKAFGGAYDVMASKHVGADVNYAWPTAQIAVMGAKGAVEIIFRNELNDPEKIAARTAEYEDRFLSPFVAAERGYIDEVIMPHSTPAGSPARWACSAPRRWSSPGRSTTTSRCKRAEGKTAACP